MTNKDVTKRLNEAIKILKTHNTPKPYVLTLHKNFYESLGREYWIDYIKRHNSNVIIKFYENGKYYILNKSGEVEVIEDVE